MVPMSLTKEQQSQLLGIARQSIQHGFTTGSALAINAADYPGIMSEPRATFVTLELDRQLRGCIGILEAIRPLVVDVAENAFAAAFRDPRFPPLTQQEYVGIELHISMLTPPELMSIRSEQDLLAQLRPNIDGLILEDGRHRATFLPSVWESIPSPLQFVQHLKQKAGLPVAYWSDSIKAYRYTA